MLTEGLQHFFMKCGISLCAKLKVFDDQQYNFQFKKEERNALKLFEYWTPHQHVSKVATMQNQPTPCQFLIL